MTIRTILPAHGSMTVEQLHGFRIACACFETWGRQLAGGGGIAAPYGRFMQGAAIALDRQLGQGAARAAPSLPPAP